MRVIGHCWNVPPRSVCVYCFQILRASHNINRIMLRPSWQFSHLQDQARHLVLTVTRSHIMSTLTVKPYIIVTYGDVELLCIADRIDVSNAMLV
jgi:hypothetical protein